MESFSSYLNLVIISTVFVGVMLILRLFLKRVPKMVNMLLWSLVALRLMCPFVVTSSVGVVPEKVVDTAVIESGLSTPVSSDTILYSSPSEDSSSACTKIAFSIWFFGSCLMLALGVKSYICLREKTSVRIRQEDNVYICDDIDTGFVLGVIKPIVLIPSTIDSRFVSHVIRHEKMHIKHKDHIWKILSYILLSLNWYNPLVWIAFISFSHDIELFCDEAVTRDYSNDARAEYAYALLSLATQKITPANVAFGEVDLETRIKALGRAGKHSIAAGIIGVLTILAVSAFFITNSSVQAIYHSEWIFPGSEEICYLCDEDLPDYIDNNSLYHAFSASTDMSTVRAHINAYLSSNWQEFADSREDISFRIDDIKYAADGEGIVAYSSVIVDGDTIPVRFDLDDGSQGGSYLSSATILRYQPVEPSGSHPVYDVI